MRPDLKIVLSSGYAGEALDDSSPTQPWPFLPKPYSQEDLTQILRTADVSAGPRRVPAPGRAGKCALAPASGRA